MGFNLGFNFALVLRKPFPFFPALFGPRKSRIRREKPEARETTADEYLENASKH